MQSEVSIRCECTADFFCGFVINICSCTGDFRSLTQTLHNAPKSIPQNFGPRYSTLEPQLGVNTPTKSPRSPFYKPLQSTLIASLPQSTPQDSITSPRRYCFNRLSDGWKCAGLDIPPPLPPLPRNNSAQLTDSEYADCYNYEPIVLIPT